MSTKKNGIDQQLIRDLAAILNETNLSEIEVEQGDVRVRVSRQSTIVHAVAAPGAPVAHAVPAAAAAPAAAAPAAPGPAAAAPARSAGNVVHSPMVGTAYASAQPGSPPFVEVGQKVREGQTLLIIEAMKTMNQIPSPRAGTVTEILFEDARPVEYGEPLVVIE